MSRLHFWIAFERPVPGPTDPLPNSPRSATDSLFQNCRRQSVCRMGWRTVYS